MKKEKTFQIATIAVAVALFLGILIYTIDFLFFKDERIKNRLTTQFCNCSLDEEIQKSRLKSVEEGFQYASLLDDKFGDIFKKYGKGLTVQEKKAFIEDLSDRIFKRCPNHIDHLFN